MIRARIWFRCAAMGDPVSPVLVSPSRIGWEAKERTVDLEIERELTGEELLRRMKGWITIGPEEVIEAIRLHGRLKLLDGRTLVVELKNRPAFEALSEALAGRFPGQVDLEPMTPLD